MAIQPTNAVYSGIQSAFQSLIEAVEKGEARSSLEEKRDRIAVLVDKAYELHQLDEAQAISLKRIRQLDVQNKNATLQGIVELQKLFNQVINDGLYKNLGGLKLEIKRAENEIEKVKKDADAKIAALQLENQLLNEKLNGYMGKAHWQKYFGEVENPPPLPRDIQRILSSPCSLWPGKQIKDTHILVFIPAMLDGKPLNLNRLQSVVEKPKCGKPITFQFTSPRIKEEFGHNSVETYDDFGFSKWALISCQAIPYTLDKNTYFQVSSLTINNFVDAASSRRARPRIFVMAASLAMEHAAYGTHKYDNTFIRCDEWLDNGGMGVVGRFNSTGIEFDLRETGKGYKDTGLGMCYEL